METIEHLENPRAFVRLLTRLARPGGWVIVTTPNQHSLLSKGTFLLRGQHVHFQDVPDMPRELLDATTRFIPGDGVSPIDAMLRKLAEKGYDGALSVELFLPRFADGDPFEVAREIKSKCEAVMQRAKVL